VNLPLTSDPDVRTELCLKLGGLLFSGSASTQRTMDSASTLLALITGISLAVLFSSSDAVATKSVAIVSPTLFLIPAVPMV